jgi:hypothetical protein
MATTQTADRSQDAGSDEPYADRPPRTRRRRRRIVAAVVAVVAVAAAAAATVALNDGRAGDESAPSTSPTAPATTDADVPSTPAPTVPPTTTTVAPTTTPALEDGRHAAMITGLDAAAGTLQVDVIQFLTGGAAIAAWDEAHPDDPGGPPNDYFIVNDNPRLRVLPVATGVTVTVVDGVEQHEIAWADLPARLAGAPMTVGNAVWPNPFWLTVSDGTITAIDEQYIP